MFIPFKFHYVYAHKFQGEHSTSGWIGCNIQLEKGFEENYTLVLWAVHNVRLSLDKFRRVEKIIL